MNRTPLSIPEIAMIAGTRAAAGAGLGLLLADRLTNEQRRAIGWTLVAVGAITTVPILIGVLRGQREFDEFEDDKFERQSPISRGRPREYVAP
jgi:hypothetical protein